jgi:hypothetical protein
LAKSDSPLSIEKVSIPSSSESPQAQHNSIMLFNESPFLAKANSVSKNNNIAKRNKKNNELAAKI